MKLSRRSFLRGAAVAAAVAPAIPLVLATPDATKVYTLPRNSVWTVNKMPNFVPSLVREAKDSQAALVQWSAINDAQSWNFRDFEVTTFAVNGA